jgi:DNA-binding MltR family transcriptional regulator
MDFPLSDYALKHESDRGAVLVGAAMLDESLARLLRAAFISKEPVQKKSISKLFGPNGPLSSFWAKLHLANVLGLLHSSLHSDLEVFRKLRNRFAHQMEPADFVDTTVRHLASLLSTTVHLRVGMNTYTAQATDGKKVSEDQLVNDGYVKTARAEFNVCLSLSLAIIEGITATVSKSGIEAGRLMAQELGNFGEVYLKYKKEQSRSGSL